MVTCNRITWFQSKPFKCTSYIILPPMVVKCHSYVLDNGFNHWKKVFCVFMVFLWSIFNICLVKIENHFHFGYHVIHLHKICYDWWHILLSRIWLVTTLSAVTTTEFYCMSPDPCSWSIYEQILETHLLWEQCCQLEGLSRALVLVTH